MSVAFFLVFYFAAKARMASVLEWQGKLSEELARLRIVEAEVQGHISAKLETRAQVDMANVRLQEMEKRLQDWEAAKLESMQNAKAAVMEVGGKLSRDLIENHRRETEEAKKNSEEAVRKTTEALLKEMTKVTTTVATLDAQVKTSSKVADTVWKALTSPGGAGHYGEIGLENTLKSFGLEAGRDFITQYSIISGSSARLRPDALVFLPNNHLMVIDAKASKHLVEMADTDDPAKLDAFLKTMSTHLKTLAGREYDSAIRAEYKECGRSDACGEIINIMYLPSEAALTNLTRADTEFRMKAFKQGIIMVGPESLAALIALCSVKIEGDRQLENYEKIMDSIRALMDALAVAISYAQTVGSSLQKASDAFSKFANSVNSRLLPKARSIERMGVRLSGSKTLPASLPGYQMVASVMPDAEEQEQIAELA